MLCLSLGDLLKYLEGNEECVHLCIMALSIKVAANRTELTVLFNNEAYHSPSLSLAVVDNILFMSLSGADASITVSNKPQPHPQAEESLGYALLRVFTVALEMPSSQPIQLYFCDKRSHWWKSASSDGSSFCSFCRSAEGKVVALKIQLGMALLVSGFCFLTVTERTTKAKHMQFLSGVSVIVYWISALVFDFIVFFISCCLLLVSDRQCFESLFSFCSTRKIRLLIDVFINIAMLIFAHYLIEHISSLGMVVTIWNFSTWKVEA